MSTTTPLEDIAATLPDPEADLGYDALHSIINEVRDIASADDPLKAAADRLADTFGTFQLGVEVGQSVNCDEADAIAATIANTGRVDDAAAFLTGHAAADEPDDFHTWIEDVDNPGTAHAQATAYIHNTLLQPKADHTDCAEPEVEQAEQSLVRQPRAEAVSLALKELVECDPVAAYNLWFDSVSLISGAPYPRVEIVEDPDDGDLVLFEGKRYSTDRLLSEDFSLRATSHPAVDHDERNVCYAYDHHGDYESLTLLLEVDGTMVPVRLPEGWKEF